MANSQCSNHKYNIQTWRLNFIYHNNFPRILLCAHFISLYALPFSFTTYIKWAVIFCLNSADKINLCSLPIKQYVNELPRSDLRFFFLFPFVSVKISASHRGNNICFSLCCYVEVFTHTHTLETKTFPPPKGGRSRVTGKIFSLNPLERDISSVGVWEYSLFESTLISS